MLLRRPSVRFGFASGNKIQIPWADRIGRTNKKTGPSEGGRRRTIPPGEYCRPGICPARAAPENRIPGWIVIAPGAQPSECVQGAYAWRAIRVGPPAHVCTCTADCIMDDCLDHPPTMRGAHACVCPATSIAGASGYLCQVPLIVNRIGRADEVARVLTMCVSTRRRRLIRGHEMDVILALFR